MFLSDLSAEGSLGKPDPPFSDTPAIVRFAECRDLTVPINLAGGSRVSRYLPFAAPNRPFAVLPGLPAGRQLGDQVGKPRKRGSRRRLDASSGVVRSLGREPASRGAVKPHKPTTRQSPSPKTGRFRTSLPEAGVPGRGCSAACNDLSFDRRGTPARLANVIPTAKMWVPVWASPKQSG